MRVVRGHRHDGTVHVRTCMYTTLWHCMLRSVGAVHLRLLRAFMFGQRRVVLTDDFGVPSCYIPVDTPFKLIVHALTYVQHACQ